MVYVRIPGWSGKSGVKVNGAAIAGPKAGEYLAIKRRWSAGDKIDLSFDMTTRLLKANPAVTEDLGKVAFQRGPIVFCMEHLDQAGQKQEMSLAGYTAHLRGETTPRYDENLLGGVMVLDHPGSISHSNEGQGLYFSAGEATEPREVSTTLKLIPYYAWANREPAAMQVWIPYGEA